MCKITLAFYRIIKSKIIQSFKIEGARSLSEFEVQEYQCPCCGGAIAFDSESQNLVCPFCGTEFPVETLISYDNELNSEQADDLYWETVAGNQWQEGETEHLKSFTCKSCGGEIVGDEAMAATCCPYCATPVVIQGQFSGTLKPDYVIPFQLDKRVAVESLKKYYGGKRFLPKVFKEQNHIEEVKGIYVPVWLFDADADANIRYKATKVNTWSDEQFDYTETSYFTVHRTGSIGFENLPVDGSEKISDELMESLEPFDFSAAVDFQTAYLAGYLADRYDVDAEQSILRANERIKKSVEDSFAATVEGYDTVTPEYSSVSLSNGQEKYALYPVWFLSTTWNGEKYIFAMNGQTGKFVGDLPMDKSLYKKRLFGVAGIVGAAVFLLRFLLWLL